jgi:putative protease
MNRPELLLPAGNIEKMNYALRYGADAVYLGISDYSLRNNHKGDVITVDNLSDAVKIAHDLNKRIYVTVNIYANNEDVKKLPVFLEMLESVRPDAIIFSDIGVGSLIKKYAPSLPMHLSTQANTCNYESARAWFDFGVQRAILARELSIAEIAEIKQNVPELELEVFVHGSLCISYSAII